MKLDIIGLIICIIGVIVFIAGVWDLPALEPGETEYKPTDPGIKEINTGITLNMIGLPMFLLGFYKNFKEAPEESKIKHKDTTENKIK
jgi:hypothetical protein